jgi:hypothetical protein
MADEWIWVTNENGMQMRVKADFYEPALSTEAGKINYAASPTPTADELISQEEQLEQQAQARPKNLMQKYLHVETRDHKIKSDMYARGKKEGWSEKRVLQEIENEKKKSDALLAKKLAKPALEAKRKQQEEYLAQHPQGDANKFGDKAKLQEMIRLLSNMTPEEREQLRPIFSPMFHGDKTDA